ncbi:hypothetical protein BB559_004494 [Furculomyces boomerangus]|uniref:mRNA 5'-phosphatase n=1 Tax=Furculomyces boomerangus TaxID=61424 RepID=A0A2T9YE63_9FUNG|nr:hypothetical protein BB559_004494 [Furculomyces boomerangus]
MEQKQKRLRQDEDFDNQDHILNKNKTSNNPLSMIMNHKPEEKIERLRLEPSIFGTKPSEDLTRCISDFLFKFADLPNIEIEGKLGLLVDKHSSSRISLPVLTETGT